MTVLKYDYPFDPDAANNTAAAVYALARAGGSTVLDVGSGPGIVSRALAGADGKQVTCIDADTSALEEAARGGVQEVHTVDLGAPDWYAPLAGRRFDTVILADVLEHLMDPDRLLRDLQEQHLVGPDSRLVISIPNASHEAILAELMTGNLTYTETGLLDNTHIRWFTRESMTALLERCGFLVTETHRTLRTLEQTEQAYRGLQLPKGVRATLSGLGLDVRTYQYVLLVHPSSAAGQVADQRQRTEEALRLAREHDVRAVQQERAARQLQETVAGLNRRVEDLQALLTEERAAVERQLDAGAAELTKLRAERDAARDKLAAAQRQVQLLQDEVRRLQRRLANTVDSATFRVGKAVAGVGRPVVRARRLLLTARGGAAGKRPVAGK